MRKTLFMKTKDAVLKIKWIDGIAVAFHPTPRGVIQFVGGYGFGAFPILCYRKLLEQLFIRKYTVVVLPYIPVTNHLTVVESLFKKHKRFRDEFPKKAEEMGLETQVYTDPKNYFWLGHSLGCEYITLLELLSSKKQAVIKDANGCNILKTEANKNAVESILQMSCQLHNRPLPIRGQSSLLIAPCFKAASVMNLFVKPTQQQIWSSIEESSDVFNLTALISFASDRLAGHQSNCNRVQQIERNTCSDVCFLTKNLKLQESNLCCELPGNHYMPLCPERKQDNLVDVAIAYLQELRKKAG